MNKKYCFAKRVFEKFDWIFDCICKEPFQKCRFDWKSKQTFFTTHESIKITGYVKKSKLSSLL